MLKLHSNLKQLMPEKIKFMPLMQYAEIQGEVVKLISPRVEKTLGKIAIKMLTKMLTGITLKYESNPKRNNEETIRIFKRGKLKTLIRFKHNKSGAYGIDTRTFIEYN